jgi:hypothetical protein
MDQIVDALFSIQVVSKNSLEGSCGPGSKQEIALVILVPRSLTGTFSWKHPIEKKFQVKILASNH